MTRKHVFLVILVVTFLAGCASAPVTDIKLDSHADPKANFSGYKTYTWLGGATILNDAQGQWEPPGFDADREIKFQINRELRNRGMSENATDPDLYVLFVAGVDMDALELKTDPETDEIIKENLPKGGLVVSFVDSHTGVVIWMGVATGEVKEDISSETAKARLEYAVTGLFKQVPK